MCKSTFPDISDQTISRMVGGLDVELYRPDDELKRLAKEAQRLGGGPGRRHPGHELFAALRETDAGAEWVADWERTADPWFRQHRPRPPGRLPRAPDLDGRAGRAARGGARVRAQARKGEAIDRPTDEIVWERDRIAGEYRELMAADDRPVFDETLALARKVFVYIEEHVLYIEHWMWAAFFEGDPAPWRRWASSTSRPEDMFFLRRHEVVEAIYDCVVGWSGVRSRGAHYWRPIVETRRRISGRPVRLGAGARARAAAGGRQRAVDGDALGHHDLEVGDG